MLYVSLSVSLAASSTLSVNTSGYNETFDFWDQRRAEVWSQDPTVHNGAPALLSSLSTMNADSLSVSVLIMTNMSVLLLFTFQPMQIQNMLLQQNTSIFHLIFSCFCYVTEIKRGHNCISLCNTMLQNDNMILQPLIQVSDGQALQRTQSQWLEETAGGGVVLLCNTIIKFFKLQQIQLALN